MKAWGEAHAARLAGAVVRQQTGGGTPPHHTLITQESP